jgi:hypothetical protein
MMQSGQCTFPTDGSCQAQTHVIGSLVPQPIWEVEAFLLFVHEENLIFQNNGEIRGLQAWEIADWFTTIDSHWSFTGDASPGHTILDIGVRLEAWDSVGVKVHDENTVEQITFYSNQTVSTNITQTDFPLGALYVKMTYTLQTYHAGPGFTLNRWAKVAAATRNRRVQ